MPSSEAELQATLKLISSSPDTAMCRFPARALWLQKRLALPELGILKCPEIREFIEKAPFDRLELVFADESITQPASVLGHSFLNISGYRNEQEVEHAISFYTHAETINFPKLLWEALITGKEGLFALTPYAQEEEKYLQGEQRNLWRYKIRTTAFERELIRNHLFELKNSKLTYFFHRYNCATLLRNILALTGDLPETSRWWTTPKDVVKDMQAAERIQTTRVSLSDAWLATNLSEDILDKANLRHELLTSSLVQSGRSTTRTAKELTALHAYNRWLKHLGKVDDKTYTANTTALTAESEANEGPSLRVHEQLDPRHSPDQMLWRTEWLDNGRNRKLRLQWIPVSHTLMQSHSHASAETEMILLSPTLSLDGKASVHVEEFQIFSMKSLTPWHSWLRPWSTQTLISHSSMTGHPLERRSFHATLQLGAMHRQGSIDLFAVAGPGLKMQSGMAVSPVLRTDAGLLWRHGLTAKSRLTWTHWRDALGSANKFEFEQSWFWKSDWLVSWKLGTVAQFASHHQSMGLSLMHSF